MPPIKKKSNEVNNARQLMDVVETNKWNKFKNTMSIKTLMKTITNVYNEKAKTLKRVDQQEHTNFAEFVYEIFLTSVGFANIADQKFLIFILSLDHYKDHFRVNMFCKFLGLIEGQNYKMVDINKFVQGFKFLEQSDTGKKKTKPDMSLTRV